MSDDTKITQAEMIELFGTEMPLEAVQVLWDSPPEWTLADVRREVRRIAQERRTSQPPMSDEIKALVERARINAAWMDEDCDCNGDKHTQCRWKCMLLAMASCIESQATEIANLKAGNVVFISEHPGKNYPTSQVTKDEAIEMLQRRVDAQAVEIERLNAEVERRIRAQGIAFDQAMSNGEALMRERAALKAAQEVKA